MGFFGNKNTEEKEYIPESEDEEDVKDKVDTYDYYSECENCGQETEYEIDFGKTVKEELVNEFCHNCGCKVLQ